jgi:hypothetical protein
MTDAELRADIAAFDPALEIVAIRRSAVGDELEALVQDAWGQYLWPWLKTQRDPVPPRSASPADAGTIPPIVASPPASRAPQLSLF